MTANQPYEPLKGPKLPCQECFEHRPWVAYSEHCEQCLDSAGTCQGCKKLDRENVKGRVSQKVYVGRLCPACCKKYRDHCGI